MIFQIRLRSRNGTRHLSWAVHNAIRWHSNIILSNFDFLPDVVVLLHNTMDAQQTMSSAPCQSCLLNISWRSCGPSYGCRNGLVWCLTAATDDWRRNGCRCRRNKAALVTCPADWARKSPRGHIDLGHTSRKERKFKTVKFDTWNKRQTILSVRTEIVFCSCMYVHA